MERKEDIVLYHQTEQKQLYRFLFIFLFSFSLMVGLVFIRVPYYVSSPGNAKDLSEMVKVEDGYQEEGSFMLTTVRMNKASISDYVVAKFDQYKHLYPIQTIKAQGESDREYTVRQGDMMEISKDAATFVAYGKAGKKVELQNEYVMIGNVIPNTPAEKMLKREDRIRQVDGQRIDSAEELLDRLKDKQAGDQVTLLIERDGKEKEVTLSLANIEGAHGRAIIGIRPFTVRKLVTDPELLIKTDHIGGPSAGLMFSLEIYNQLTKEDYTHGKKIAGTGTIDIDGNVGPIGGVDQKVIAAHEAGAEIFFAPNENGAENSDYKRAVETAKNIKTNMKIVPVDTFDDALTYLNTLK